MRVHLVNPSDVSFGVGVITPRWLYVLAGARHDPMETPLSQMRLLSHFRSIRSLREMLSVSGYIPAMPGADTK
jgi:hypothetical protein